MFLTLPRIIYSPLLQLSTKVTFLHRSDYKKNLELRQYKNGFVSAKRMFVLKLPPFFPWKVREKGRQFQNKYAFHRNESVLILS